MVGGSGEGEGVQLTAAQELMIQQLVAAQLQCNKRSFSDWPKVTISPFHSFEDNSPSVLRVDRATVQGTGKE